MWSSNHICKDFICTLHTPHQCITGPYATRYWKTDHIAIQIIVKSNIQLFNATKTYSRYIASLVGLAKYITTLSQSG